MPAHASLADGIDVDSVRSHFDFVAAGRVVTNNAASTQPPRELVELYRRLTPWYDNVHRGQSAASRRTTDLFESSYDTVAQWLNAPSRRSIVMFRNTTEAINSVMYSLMTEFRDGDNVVTTMLEHNSNFVPWYGLCHEILPRFGRRVECRVARFDGQSGRLDVDHLASLVDERTKLVCCTGASNFFGTKPDLPVLRVIANASGYHQPNGERRSLLLVDGAQLLPTTSVDVQALDVDYLSFSFHKVLAPFGAGVLYAKEHLFRDAPPFLYGGDMIAEGQVSPDRVVYNDLPWKYTAGTPNILGAIVSAQALRLLVDLAGAAPETDHFATEAPLSRPVVEQAMERIGRHTAMLTAHAVLALRAIDGLTLYGPPACAPRAPVVAFAIGGMSPFAVAEELDRLGVESRAGCHCATLAPTRSASIRPRAVASASTSTTVSRTSTARSMPSPGSHASSDRLPAEADRHHHPGRRHEFRPLLGPHIEVEIGGQRVPFIFIEDLLASKKASGRPDARDPGLLRLRPGAPRDVSDIAFLFSRDPAVADYPMGWGNTKPNASWFKPGFPIGYVSDTLQTLEILAELGHGRDPRLARALAWVEAGQDEQGRWLNRHAYNGKTWIDIDHQGQVSKWVTLRACTVLRAAYG